ncbi:MAG: hypothetical protein HQL45_11155 [Alphaproteobacteria bacterium]|nr:hypothetical protein [Alphaproteobacteria bacterium]
MKVVLSLLLLFFSFSVMAADNEELPAPVRPEFPTSLMLTPEESSKIELLTKTISRVGAIIDAKSQGNAEAQPVPPPMPKPNIVLSALIYTSATDWSAWINGLRYGPGSVQSGIRSVRATPRWVELDVDTLAGDVEGPTVRVRLSPNQTYLSKEDRVVDGIFP